MKKELKRLEFIGFNDFTDHVSFNLGLSTIMWINLLSTKEINKCFHFKFFFRDPHFFLQISITIWCYFPSN